MSGQPRVGVKQVLLYAALRRGALTLVECDDGGLRVLRDDMPVAECRWESHELERAATAFRRIAARLRDDPDTAEQ